MIHSEALQRTYDKVRAQWDPHFEWVVNEAAPWTLLQKPLDQIALALVSTCGAYRKEIDCPGAGRYPRLATPVEEITPRLSS